MKIRREGAQLFSGQTDTRGEANTRFLQFCEAHSER